MVAVGNPFVGSIAVAGPPFPPTPIIASTLAVTSGAIVTATLPPPSGIRAGMPMAACVSAGAYAQFAPNTYGFTADPAWTPVYEDPTNGFNHWIIPNLYTKIADDDDEAGTASYSWTVDAGGALGGMAVAILCWPTKFGTTVSGGSADYTLTPSIATAGGAWQLAFITQRTHRAGVVNEPDPVLTSAATLLVDDFSGTGSTTYRAGTMRVYASQKVSPVTGAYLIGVNDGHQAMVVATVS